MKQRIAAIGLALVLAIIGTGVLLAFVRSAESRAQAGEEVIDILVSAKDLPAGTSVDDLTESVRVEKVPVKLAAEDNLGSVERLAALEGKVTAVDLFAGEQIVEHRIVDRSVAQRQNRRIEVPGEYVEIALSLEPERAIGGSVQPGDTVGVIASFEPFELSGSADDTVIVDGEVSSGADNTPNTSHFLLHAVLVTNVQLEELPRQVDENQQVNVSASELAPTGNLLVTLAMVKADAERMAFTAEFGTVWLTAETAEATQDNIQIQTRGSVYIPGNVR